MSSLATNSIDDPAAASIYESVIGQLKEASFVSPPVDSSSYFDPVVNIEVSELNDKGISKTRYMPFKRPSEMSAADYDRLPPKHNWSPDVKKGTASIQMLTSVMPQKTPLDKYRDRKASIAAMLAAGDITADVSKQLMTKLESELLDSNLI